MRTIFLLALVPLFLAGVVLADQKKTEPDFSKVFPEEKIFSTTDMEELGIETYAYLTNTPMEKLEKTLTKFLSKGWKKEEMGSKIKGHLKVAQPDVLKIPIEIERMVHFTAQDMTLGTVMLSQSKMESGETKFMVSIMVMRGRKDVEEKSPQDKSQTDAPTGGILKPSQKKPK